MPRIAYISKNFAKSSLRLIEQANEIIGEYAAQGFDLTLRQLYYQFVARGLIPNKQTEYSRLGSIVNDARMAGLIDWNTIVDRTRNLREQPHWDSPAAIVVACAKQFRIDKWARQPVRPEVWIEKDALVGVIEGVCKRYDVPHFSCRGYTSQSEMWRAGQRLLEHGENGQATHIIHLGDHDPSGIDMTRDIEDRLRLFMYIEGHETDVTRIALNMEQVEEFEPPPNPAKITDSRARVYIERFGDESWELDALEPTVLAGLIEEQLLSLRDDALWAEAVDEEAAACEKLAETAAMLEDDEL